MPSKTNEDMQSSKDLICAETADHAFDQILDITKDVCPITFVRTRLALDRLPSGAVLLVRLTGREPAVNVPRTAEAQGHHVVAIKSTTDGVTLVWLRRK